MSGLGDRDPALRLWRAETRWLAQCAARLRRARTRRRPDAPPAHRTGASTAAAR